MLAHKPQSTAFGLQLALLWRVPLSIHPNIACHVTPNLSLPLKPSQLGSQFPRGWWIYAFSPFSTCTAVSGSFRRPKAEGCRGLHNLDGSRSNGVSLRHSCGEAMWTSWSFSMGLRSAPFAGRATGSRRPDPMDIPGIEDVDALRPTSVS